MGLIETLFARNVMHIGPSRNDPQRMVGTFNPDFLAGLPALRGAELRKFHWIAGTWRWENPVPVTALSPAYTDAGTVTFVLGENDTWVCLTGPGGKLIPNITFDPFSRRWMYVLTNGSYCVLRSPGWVGNQIVFTGPMSMIGIDCEWRMTWTKKSDDEFTFVNEEQLTDGSWAYIDEWRYWRMG
jgi:hypothetical protein